MGRRRRTLAKTVAALGAGLALALAGAAPAYAISTTDLTFNPAPVHGVIPSGLMVKGYAAANIAFRLTNRTDKPLLVDLGDESAKYGARKSLEFGPPTAGAAAHIALPEKSVSLAPHQTRSIYIRVDPAVTGDAVVTAAAIPPAGRGVSVVERLGILIQIQSTRSPHPGNSWMAAWVTGGIIAFVLLLLLVLLLLRRRRKPHAATAVLSVS